MSRRAVILSAVPVSTAARTKPFLPENLIISFLGSFTYIPAIPSTTTLQLPSTRAWRRRLFVALMEPIQRMMAEYTGTMSALSVVNEWNEGMHRMEFQ